MSARKFAMGIAMLFLVLFPQSQRGVAALVRQGTGLRIEDLSVSIGLPTDPRQVTINFRLVNSGPEIPIPFRTSISAAGAAQEGSAPGIVTIPPLPAGEVVFASRTVSIPAGQTELDVRVEADVDGVLGSAPIVIGGKFNFFPHVPGFWFSIGPTRVHAPAVPASSNSPALGQYDATGRLAAIAVHPTNPDVIYVGSPGQLGHEGCGLWKTSDGGKTWAPIMEGQDLPLSIAAVAIDPTNPERVYVVTPDDGLFRSEDGGQVWSRVTLWAAYPDGPRIWRNTDIGDPTVLLIHPDKPNVLFLTSEQGVWRSLDSGKTWGTVPSLGGGRASSLVMSPINHDVLYAARDGVGVFRTANASDAGGVTWTKLTMPPENLSPKYGLLLGINALSSPTRSIETLYALVADPADPATTVLLRTTTAGTGAWEERYRCTPKDSHDQECNFMILSVDPLNRDIVYLGGPVLVTSAAGSFERVPPANLYNDRQPASPHGDYHGFAINPLNRAIVYAASDGGIFCSTDHGKTGTWAFIGEGITNAEVYDLAEAASQKGRLIAGTQDNGNIQYDEDLVWKHIEPDISPTQFNPFGGDGGLVAIDPIDPELRYVMTADGKSLKRWDAGSQGFVDFSKGIQDDCYNWNSTFHFQIFPTNNHFLLASCVKLYITSTSPSYIWSSTFAPSSPVVRSAIDPKSDRVYAGTDHGELFQRVTGGAFIGLFDNPTGTPVSDIDIDPHHSDTVFVSYAPAYKTNRDCENASRGNVYQVTVPRFVEVTKGRQSQPTAVDISGDLPANLCVNALAVDPVTSSVVYAATNKGVYLGRLMGSRNGFGWVWRPYGTGMPPADVRDLEIHPTTGHMHAATFGRGIFEVILR